ncbi:hypothetical protein WDW37_05520 [Bdellovibrionota bacterium FG-1]
MRSAFLFPKSLRAFGVALLLPLGLGGCFKAEMDWSVEDFSPTTSTTNNDGPTITGPLIGGPDSSPSPLPSPTIPQALMIEPLSLLSTDFGSRYAGTPVSRSFMLKNQSNSPLILSSAPGFASKPTLDFLGHSFPGDGGNCGIGLTLESGYACIIFVSFEPPKDGPIVDTLQIEYSTQGATLVTSQVFSGLGTLDIQPLQIAAGGNQTCALLNNGALKCWGNNLSGQLGIGDYNSRGDSPSPGSQMGYELPAVPLIAGSGLPVFITVKNEHMCVLLESGKIRCWGNNGYGQLGYEDITARNSAAQSPDINLGSQATAFAVATGAFHSCAIVSDGLVNRGVKCWGGNGSGQLGYDTTNPFGSSPNTMGDALDFVYLGSGRSATSLALGQDFSCALLDDGSVKCWGNNVYGQLGQGDVIGRGDTNAADHTLQNLIPINLGTGQKAKAIAAGLFSACALLDNGTVKCWGNNDYGQLGQGDKNNRGSTVATMGDGLLPVSLGSGRIATSLSMGNWHVCVHLDNGLIKCWGNNNAGELGLETMDTHGDDKAVAGHEMGDLLYPVNLGTNAIVKQITTGTEHTCALLMDSHIKCWGSNGNGQLGLNHASQLGWTSNQMGNALPAVQLGSGRRVLKLEIGSAHACAILESGDLKCWGQNGDGQLGLENNVSRGNGINTMGNNLPPVQLGSGRRAVQVALGYYHTCALLDNSQVKCWGGNTDGQLGLNLSNGTKIGDLPGSLGDILPVVDLGAGRTALKVTAGNRHTCTLLDNHSVKCWGYNGTGALGQNDTLSKGNDVNSMSTVLPVDFGDAGLTMIDIASGGYHNCALTQTGQVRCWGDNLYGQLGVDDTTSRGYTATPPYDTQSIPSVNLGAGRTAVAIAAGSSSTCAILDNGYVKCWGLNGAGQLGQGDTTSRGNTNGSMTGLSAINLGASFAVTQISMGNASACALSSPQGAIKCWGLNSAGQLGLGDAMTRGDGVGPMGNDLPPVNLGSNRYALKVVVGDQNTCALLDDQSLRCWGSSGSGINGKFPWSNLGDTPNKMGDFLFPVEL